MSRRVELLLGSGRAEHQEEGNWDGRCPHQEVAVSLGTKPWLTSDVILLSLFRSIANQGSNKGYYFGLILLKSH